LRRDKFSVGDVNKCLGFHLICENYVVRGNLLQKKKAVSKETAF